MDQYDRFLKSRWPMVYCEIYDEDCNDSYPLNYI